MWGFLAANIGSVIGGIVKAILPYAMAYIAKLKGRKEATVEAEKRSLEEAIRRRRERDALEKDLRSRRDISVVDELRRDWSRD